MRKLAALINTLIKEAGPNDPLSSSISNMKPKKITTNTTSNVVQPRVKNYYPPIGTKAMGGGLLPLDSKGRPHTNVTIKGTTQVK